MHGACGASFPDTQSGKASSEVVDDFDHAFSRFSHAFHDHVYTPHCFLVGRFYLDVVQAGRGIIRQSRGTGILVIHVWHQVGYFLDTLHAFHTFHFLLTGFHAAHVLAGMILLAVVGWIASPRAVETGAAFWHMVDLVWVLLFPVIYLL